MPDELGEFAYEDTPLPIKEGQTISQPYIVALMIAANGPRPDDRVLEIGAGSGYAAAVLSWVAGQVVEHLVEPAVYLAHWGAHGDRPRWGGGSPIRSGAAAARRHVGPVVGERRGVSSRRRRGARAGS